VHNCLEDLGVSYNIIPFSICQKINVVLQIRRTRIIQLDKTDIEEKSELKDVLIILSSDHGVHQTIDIIVVDIPESYGLLLNKDWSEKNQGYFSTDWSHLWLSYKAKVNKIYVNSEAHSDGIVG
jgi:hypothetical protein